MTNQSLTLEFREHGQRFLDRSLRRFREPSNAEIHDVESVEAKISKVVVSAVDEFLARKSRNPGLVFTPTSAELGDDYETFGIRIKRPLDELISDVRTVVVAGIDVVHPESTASRRTAIAASTSRGGPHTSGPASCIAP
jgi:hypothetical protein